MVNRRLRPHPTLTAVLTGTLLMAGVAMPALYWGCGPSSPRFRTAGEVSDKDRDDENELRFAARIREEEAREDDRRVNLEETRKYLTRRSPAPGKYPNRTPAGLDRDRVLIDLIDYLGVPYVYGGNSKSGIDCSGFTKRVYDSAVDRQLPRSTREQFSVGAAVRAGELQFGDLVFFNTTGRVPSHVGIYIEDDLFAHASVTRGVTISSLESSYYRKRFVGARRVIQE